MKFNILSVEDYEMVHYGSSDLFIAHKGEKITYRRQDREQIISMPGKLTLLENAASKFRKARRLLRLDKAVILPADENLLLFRRHEIWRYSFTEGLWEKCHVRLNCRNPMYNGVLRTPDGDVFIGEYGNPNGAGKRIFKSSDNGMTWECVYTFKPDEIRHIHCLSWDPFEEKIWVFTGDSDHECKVLCCDSQFNSVIVIGQGSQAYRACHAFFSEKYVDWIMDSPLETVRHVRLDRNTGEIGFHSEFAGPVWFTGKLKNGYAIASSVQETGPSHKDKRLHIYASKDMDKWEEVASFEHDRWPKKLFRFGTITVARGESSDNCFYLFCEGVRGFDGKSMLCNVIE